MKVLRKILIILAIVIGSLLMLVLILKAGERIIYKDFYSQANREFKIPGLNHNIVPQGLDYISEKELFLMCGYHTKGDASRVYVIDKDGKATFAEMKQEDGSDYTGHTGGIVHVGPYVYVTGSGGLEVFLLDDLLDGDQSLRQVGHVTAFLEPGWCYIVDDYILTGSFYKSGSYETPAEERLTTPAGDQNTSLVTVFKLDDTQPFGIDPVPVAAISTPDCVQGFCLTDRAVVLSISWGLSSSYLQMHDVEKLTVQGTYTIGGQEVPLLYIDSASLTESVKAPPMSEGIVWHDGRIYVLNESASNQYIFGKLLSGNHLYSYAPCED